MKIVIWGCGIRGKRLLEYIDNKYVAAFIDSNPDLYNKEYKGIPIINYEDYKQLFRDTIIFVSPLDYTEEIAKVIDKKDLLSTVFYRDSENSFIGAYMQYGIDKILNNYSSENEVLIYGYNLLSLMLYMSFMCSGHKASIILPSDTNEKKIEELENKKINICPFDDIPLKNVKSIILSEPIEDRDKKLINRNIIQNSYYAISLKKELFKNKKIEKFKNCHYGEKCFIVATGPSLKMNDLDILHKNNIVCFSMNGIFKAFGQTKWYPDYYVASDSKVINFWEKQIYSLNSKAIFLSDMITSDTLFKKNNVYKWHLLLDEIIEKPPEFSSDFSFGGYCGSTVTYDGCLQLAVYMGFKEIYLLGVDCCNYGDKGTVHFTDDYTSKDFNGHLYIEKNILAYEAAKKYADEHGIKIYNATRGGNLEVFERVNFDDLFCLN